LTVINSPILEALTEFFTAEGWPFHKIEGEDNLQIGFQGENGLWNCFTKARDELNQLLFYSVCPVLAPLGKRGAVAEFIARANYGIVVGNFEMDYETGVIRYKTYLSADGIRLTNQVIRQVVFPNLLIMDQFLPGLLKTIYGEISPAKAVEASEFW
jgi:hypothetical protein